MTHRVLLSAVLALAGASCATSALPPLETRPEPIQLASCRVPKSTTSVFCGKYVVFENRAHDYPQRVGYERRGADAIFECAGCGCFLAHLNCSPA